ncbi:MAG: MerR family transcriptional regulator [bacterium]
MNALNLQSDALYPMRVVSRLTGLSSHTIRVWERRYQAVVPQRSLGNTRQYSAADVRRLALLGRATSVGHRIRELAKLPDGELELMLEVERGASSAPAGAASDHIDQLRASYLAAVQGFDSRGATELLTRAAMLMNSSVLALEVILPILRETGDRWEKGAFSVAHEHLVSFHMRGLLDTLLRLTGSQAGAPGLVVATPSGHQHEFGALAGAIIAAARGFDPIYLGPEVPEKDLALTLQLSRNELLLLGIVRHMSPRESDASAAMLRNLSKIAEVWVGLPPDHPDHSAVEGVRYFDRFEDLDLALTQRAQ